MNLHEQDWNTAERVDRMARLNRQNRMEIADEELPKESNPLAVWAALVMVVVAVFFAVMLVLHFADVIDGRPAVNVKLAEVTNARNN